MNDNQPKQDTRFGPPVFELLGLAYQISMLNIINKRELFKLTKEQADVKKLDMKKYITEI